MSSSVAPAVPAVEGDTPCAEAPAPGPADPLLTAAKLAELFPGLFGATPKPIKLRIQHDIQARAPGVFSKQALTAFFRRYTNATSYLVALSKATQRFDLDGQPVEALSEEHRQVAVDELARRRALRRERQEQQDSARRQRAVLLRDYETTKLTEANFCALKGLTTQALAEQLALARSEAAAQPEPRGERPAHRAGPRPGARRSGQEGAHRSRADAPRGPQRGK